MRWTITLIFACLVVAGLGLSLNTKPGRPADGPVAIEAMPLVLNASDPAQVKLGPLHYLGGWELKSRRTLFGGLSSMAIRPGGEIWALSDGGVMFEFPEPAGHDKFIGLARVLRTAKPEKSWMPRPEDSEATAVDPDFRHVWVGYELMQLICRYTADLNEKGTCRAPKAMADWPETESIESLARLPDGRFVSIAEGAPGKDGGRDMLVFAGDPVEATTPAPTRMSYMPPTGYDPTDAVYIGNGKLLVLNRRATLYDGFTSVLKLIDINHIKSGAIINGPEIARFAPPILADNFEGLALEHIGNQRILWMVSDDNHLFLQRTLLLKFALDDSL